ncbi:MAG: sialidase-1 [Kiritimatiellia bacterium]|jgi:sialidase-1
MIKYPIYLLSALLVAVVPTLRADPVPAQSAPAVTISDWKGFAKQSFSIKGAKSYVVVPKIAAPGKPWIWRTSFPNYHPEVDQELLKNGYHLGFIDCVSMLGADPALDLMDAFYDHVRAKWSLAERPALEAVSRGGLHAYRYAARHPERIAAIYADVPVMDLKSWPMKHPGSKRQVSDALKYYGFADDAALRAYRGNPLDLLPVIAKAKIPLRHVIALDDSVVPAKENTLAAAKLLAKLGHQMEVITVEKGDPRMGGHHFTLPEIYGSVQFLMRHASVMPGDDEHSNLRRGLANCADAFKITGKGRVAFLGGSITYNGGWRDELMRYFRKRFPDTEFTFVAAGISSMGSVPHAFRLETDVLAKGPVDLLFVEAAVNDAANIPNYPKQMLRGMEGTIRHARKANPMTDIVQLHFVMPTHMDDYRKGKVPIAIAQHEKVAEAYGCVSLDLAREVTQRIDAGQFTWKGDFRNLHPSPYGQRVYANSMMRMLETAYHKAGAPAKHAVPTKMLDPKSYSSGRFGPLVAAKNLKGFEQIASWKPTDGKGTRKGYVSVPALVATAAGASFEYDFKGRGIGLLVTSGPDAGVIEFSIDGGDFRKIDTITKWSGGLHLPWALILDDGLSDGAHNLQVRTTRKANGREALRVFQFLLN